MTVPGELDCQALLSQAGWVRRMPREDVYERVAGRVTSLSGGPLEGLDVVLERRIGAVRSFGSEHLWSFAARTDAEGRFAFEDVSRGLTSVSVQGLYFGVAGFRRAIGPGDDVEALELAVPTSIHVQVDLGGEEDADAVEVLDARGEKLQLTIQHGQSAYSMDEIELQKGRTEPFSVSETGKTLVVYRKGEEVRRLPLDLVPGQLNTIRP